MSERRFRERDVEIVADVRREGDRIVVRLPEGDAEVLETARVGTAEWVLRDSRDARAHSVHAVRDDDRWWLHVDGRTHVLERVPEGRRGVAAAASDDLVAPIPATVREVLVAAGDTVAAEQVVAVLSAMKMQIDLRAPRDGEVETVAAAAGDQVDGGQVVVRLRERPSDT